MGPKQTEQDQNGPNKIEWTDQDQSRQDGPNGTEITNWTEVDRLYQKDQCGQNGPRTNED